jgi:hypothetical protein
VTGPASSAPVLLRSRAPQQQLLFPEKHPNAGGSDHYAAYLANTDGFEVELVAQPRP